MKNEIIDISLLDLSIAGILILIVGIISIILKLKIEKKIFIASIRSILQLLLIGYALKWIFKLDNWIFILLILILMSTIAAYTSIKRSTHNYKKVFFHSFLSIVSATAITISIVMLFILHIEPWYNPQYMIPLCGMILGNSLNSISLGFDRYISSLIQKKDEIDDMLTIAATTWEANREIFRDAIKTGCIPVLNNMMVIGLVTLPGLMTGQILSGVDPFISVKYQILIIIMILFTNFLSLIIFLYAAYRKLFQKNIRLKIELIRKLK